MVSRVVCSYWAAKVVFLRLGRSVVIDLLHWEADQFGLHKPPLVQPKAPEQCHASKTIFSMPLNRYWICFTAHFALTALPLNAQQGYLMKPNQHQYYYCLTPTGFNAPTGQSMVQNGMLALSQYQKTNQNGNTWGLGMIPLLLIGESQMPVWLFGHKRVPLWSRNSKPFSVLNMGGFFASIPRPKGRESEDTNDLSFFYLNTTFGSPEKNFALGGFAAPTGFGKGVYPSGFSLHGLTRLGKYSCLVTENYVIRTSGHWVPFSMSGGRFWKRRLALDCMFALTKIPGSASDSGQSRFLILPWVAVHYNRQRVSVSSF